jgi:NAD dependent epimerase/dehydratase family enzyme
LGGKFGAGTQWQSWISIDDEVAAIVYLLEHEVDGPVNLTAPHPVTNAEFTKTLASVLKRPAILPVPSFGPKLLLGAELAQNLLFDGQRVVPAVLESSGYRFAHPDLETALRSLLGR